MRFLQIKNFRKNVPFLQIVLVKCGHEGRRNRDSGQEKEKSLDKLAQLGNRKKIFQEVVIFSEKGKILRILKMMTWILNVVQGQNTGIRQPF